MIIPSPSIAGRSCPAKRSSRHELTVILAIAVGALLLQLLYLWVYRHQVAFFSHPTGDSTIYLELAEQLVKGDGTTTAAAYRAPGYQYLLALILWLSNGRLLWVYVCQLLMNITTLVLVYALARRTGGRIAAFISAALIGLCGPLWFYASKLSGASAVVMLVTAAALLVLSLKRSRLIAAGLLLGVAILLWPGVLLIALSIAAATMLLRQYRWQSLLLLGAAVCIPIVPITIRNALLLHDFVPISANSGLTFYQGNNRLALGTLAHPPEVYEFTPSGKVLSSISDQEKFDHGYVAAKLNRPVKPSRASWFWTQRALDWIWHNPGPYLILLGRKLLLAFSDYDSATEYDMAMERELVWPLRLGIVGFGLLLSLATLGLTLSPSRHHWSVIAVAAGTTAALLMFYVNGRYRLPIFPSLAVLAGQGTASLITAIRRRRYRRLALPLSAAVLVYTLSAGLFVVPLQRGSMLLMANAYRNLGEVLLGAVHDRAAGIRMLQRSVELQRRHADPNNRQEQADLHATEQLLQALRQASDKRGAPATAQPDPLAAAQTAWDEGDTTTALKQALAALAADSNQRGAYLIAGAAYGAKGDADSAQAVFEAAARRFPADPVILYNLSLAALRAGRSQRALAAAEEVLRLVPEHPLAGRVATAARRQTLGR